MSVDLNVLPEKSPLKFILLRKRLPVIEKLAKLFDLEKFVHDCLNALTSGEFNMKDYKESVSPDELQQVVEAVKLFTRQVVNLALPKEKVEQDVTSLGMSAAAATILWTTVNARRAEVRKALQNQQATLNQNYLKDFDWKVSLTMASDQLSKLRRPVLLLDLTLYQNEKEEAKHVIFELSKEELDTLIGTLDGINQELIKLKA